MIIGVGTDIVDIKRINLDISKKILTKSEMELFLSLTDIRKPEWLAGRFAAKEAIFKALDIDIPINKIEVLYDGYKPICNILGYKIHISISHEKDYAIAYCIVEKN